MSDDDMAHMLGDQEEAGRLRAARAARGESLGHAAREVERRRRMYVEVFSSGPTSQEAIDYVIADMVSTAFVFQSAPPDILERVEGRREIVFRVLAHVGADAKTLLNQYLIETQRRQDVV